MTCLPFATLPCTVQQMPGLLIETNYNMSSRASPPPQIKRTFSPQYCRNKFYASFCLPLLFSLFSFRILLSKLCLEASADMDASCSVQGEQMHRGCLMMLVWAIQGDHSSAKTNQVPQKNQV